MAARLRDHIWLSLAVWTVRVFESRMRRRVGLAFDPTEVCNPEWLTGQWFSEEETSQ